MKELIQHDPTRIFVGGANLLVDDGVLLYVYHLACGGLKFVHVYGEVPSVATTYEYQQVVQHMTRRCECIKTGEPLVTRQQLLANIYNGLAGCKTLDDVKEMIELVASREEMAEVTP